MKEVWKLMDEVKHNQFRPFMKLAVVMSLLQYGFYVTSLRSEEYFSSNLYLGIGSSVCISLAVCFFLHIKRQRRIAKCGGFDRIRLLPISKRAYYISELVTIFTSLCIQLLGFMVCIYLIYFTDGMFSDTVRNGWIYTLMIHPEIQMIFPLTLSQFALSFTGLLFITNLICVACISLHASGFSAVVSYGLIFLSIYAAFTSSSMGTIKISAGVLTVVNVAFIWYMDRLFTSGKIGD